MVRNDKWADRTEYTGDPYNALGSHKASPWPARLGGLGLSLLIAWALAVMFGLI